MDAARVPVRAWDAAVVPGTGCRAWDADKSGWGLRGSGKGRTAWTGPCQEEEEKMETVTISTVQHSSKMLTCGKAEISHYFYSNAIVTANLVTHDRPETIIRQSFFSGKSPTASIHISHSICTNLYVRCCMGSRQRVVA